LKAHDPVGIQAEAGGGGNAGLSLGGHLRMHPFVHCIRRPATILAKFSCSFPNDRPILFKEAMLSLLAPVLRS
jgi:hypothetical protein